MKKYVKPKLFYESFELTQFIAANCGYRVEHTDVACVDANLGEGAADLIMNGFLEGYCWTNGSENGNHQLFAS